jgi:hypothetical protein
LRRRLHAERAAAHVGAIEIEAEDLFLAEPLLQPERENASVILREIDRSLLRKTFFASCWVIEEPPWTTPPAWALTVSARSVPMTSMPK